MNFPDNFTITDQIQSLQRWILVQSFIYYELNENIATDHQYDNNVNLLFTIRKLYPREYAESRYNVIFENYEEGCTSGFELLEKVRKLDPELHHHLHIDAMMALDAQRSGINGFRKH